MTQASARIDCKKVVIIDTRQTLWSNLTALNKNEQDGLQ